MWSVAWYAVWSVARCVVCGLWSAVCAVQCALCAIRGPWSVVRGPWSVFRGPWSVVRGPWSVATPPCPPTPHAPTPHTHPHHQPFHALVFAGMWSAAVEYARTIAPVEHQGTVQALVRGSYYLVGIGVGSQLGGYLIEQYDYRYVWVGCVGWAGCGLCGTRPAPSPSPSTRALTLSHPPSSPIHPFTPPCMLDSCIV